ncbi:MAG TPA: prepilin-type N-terminal cleavage/methylation domain-containing protein [Vicinamibacterales bacterium]|jgi:prepilin-type N-terminal cleavage/methylation domain-containing protein
MSDEVKKREGGFTLIEILVALAILTIAAAPMLYVTAGAQRLAHSQSEAADLHQRARVIAEKIQRDIAMAGAGPPLDLPLGSLSAYIPAVIPARTGARSPDAALTAFDDRCSIVYVPDDGWSARLAVDMPDQSAGIAIDASIPGCPAAGLCGFTAGTRALILDTTVAGAGHDAFSVTALDAELAHGPPNPPLSKAYGAATARVMPIVQRVYHFDRAARRLMLYDGYQSDVPLVDNVVDARFEYFVDAAGGVGPRRIALTELIDGPVAGLPPNQFDRDLLRIRLMRVTLRLQAAADDVRGGGAWFARPGRSTSGYSLVPDVEVSFDVALRNARGGS